MNETAKFFEGVANDLGLSIKIPRPGKRMKRASVITNSAVGIGLFTAGIIISSKALIGLGALGLAGAVFLAAEK